MKAKYWDWNVSYTYHGRTTGSLDNDVVLKDKENFTAMHASFRMFLQRVWFSSQSSDLVCLVVPLYSTHPLDFNTLKVLYSLFSEFMWRNNILKLLVIGGETSEKKKIFFFFFFFFLEPPLHMEVPWLKVESELQLPAYTIAKQCRTWVACVTYTTAHHKARSGIKPASSCLLDGFITTEPQWGTPKQKSFLFISDYLKLF